MALARIAGSLRDVRAGDINLMAGTGLSLGVRAASYLFVGVVGIVMARTLGAHDRGLYSLVTVTAGYATLLELGISPASVYLVGQKRWSLQSVVSNNQILLLVTGGLWIGVCLAAGLARPGFLSGNVPLLYLLVAGLGGFTLMATSLCKDLVIASGSVLGYNLIDFSEPFLRGGLILVAVLVLGLGLGGVLSAWLVAGMISSIIGVRLLAGRSRLTPRFSASLTRAQLSYGLRGYLAYLLQGANQRMDVFFVAGIAGSAALGRYAVAYGMAELLWQIPISVAVVFFPKASAMEAADNTQVATTTCRRVLFLTVAAVIGFLVVGRWLFSLYGADFESGVWAFYILCPSALFYVVYKVLQSSLAARGKPETSLYSGLAALPATLALDMLLIPHLGIEGAALASLFAYALNAAVILAIFLRVTGCSLSETLLVNRADLALGFNSVRALLGGSRATQAPAMATTAAPVAGLTGRDPLSRLPSPQTGRSEGPG